MDILTIAAYALGSRLSMVERLRGSERSSVVRATVDGGPRTVVVKAHDPAYADNWRRESAALAMLRGRGLPVPQLLATVDDPPLVVLSDAGSGANLADALLSGTAAAATDRLHAWVDAMATLHAATHGGDLSTVDPPAGPLVDHMPDLLAGAADLLAESLPMIGVPPDGQALADLRAIAGRLTTRADSLTPADTCPDNNVLTPDGLVLLDFEQACVRHVAWDAAYLLVPWPSCWCSWALPDRVAQAALSRWRSAVTAAIPAVAGADFDHDLDIAVVAWAVVTSAWFLAGAVDEEQEPPGAADRPRPTRRTVIRHRMRLVTGRRALVPTLAAMADDVLAATDDDWGDHPLAMAPAYR
jgi:Ser/Thr protein kinase RdoA (MazF antagonist)